MIKTIFVSLVFLLTLNAQAACLNQAKEAATWLESKHSKVAQNKVTIPESKELGGGGLLELHSVFVESPKTGDNTHWELVAEIKNCKMILSRRYWAH